MRRGKRRQTHRRLTAALQKSDGVCAHSRGMHVLPEEACLRTDFDDVKIQLLRTYFPVRFKTAKNAKIF